MKNTLFFLYINYAKEDGSCETAVPFFFMSYFLSPR